MFASKENPHNIRLKVLYSKHTRASSTSKSFPKQTSLLQYVKLNM
jgi:hypothetical protein